MLRQEMIMNGAAIAEANRLRTLAEDRARAAAEAERLAAQQRVTPGLGSVMMTNA